MESVLLTLFSSVISFSFVNSLPPAACYQPFRWDDCGRRPEPVIYYYKPGSRCEVGYWRGCYPNLNMFKDEYECVSTCIFSARAQPIDYHSLNELDDYNLALNEIQENVTESDMEPEEEPATSTDGGGA